MMYGGGEGMGVGILIYNSTITTLGNMLDVITATAEWKD